MKRFLQICILIFFTSILGAISQTSSYYLTLNTKKTPGKACADNQNNFVIFGAPLPPNRAWSLYANGNTSVPIASSPALPGATPVTLSVAGGTFTPGIYSLSITSKDFSSTVETNKLATGLVTVDGIINEPYVFNNYAGSGAYGPGQSPVGISYATLWDDDYLYIAAKFIDNTPFPPTINTAVGVNNYQYDSFEIYYDPLNWGQGTSGGAPNYSGCTGANPCGLVKQLRVGMGSNSFDPWPNPSNTIGIQVATATLTGTIYGNNNPPTLYSGNGWAAEFKIPWSTFFGVATVPGPGFSFGFLIDYNDNVDGSSSPRSNQIFSTPNTYGSAWASASYSLASQAKLGDYVSTVTGLPFTSRGETFFIQDTFNLTVAESPVVTADLTLSGDCSSSLTLSLASGSGPVPGSKEIYYWNTPTTQYTKTLLASVPYVASAPVTLSGITLRSLNTFTGCWSAPKTFEFVPTSPGQYLTPAIITNYLCTAAEFISTITGIPNNLLYWETTSTGTSTANSSLNIQNITLSGSDIYLRAENTLTGCWSNGAAYASASFTGLNPPAPSTINGLGLITCVGYELNYLSTVPSGVVWYWQLSTVTAPVKLYSSNTFIAEYAGDYYLTSELKGCWSDTITSFTVSNTGLPDLRNVGIDAVTPACEKTEIKISSSYTIPPTLTLYWEFNPSDTLKDLSISSSILVTTPGSFPVYIRAKDQQGCWSPVSNMAGGTVFVNSKPAKPTEPVGDTSSCTNIIASVSTLPGNFTYYWENSETGTGDSLIAANTRILTQSGTYFVRSKVNDASNCWSDTATMIKVTIETKPAAPTDLKELQGCGVTTITSSVAQPAGVTYFWQLNDSSKALNNSGQNFVVNKQGTFTYYVRAKTDKAQCWSDSNMISFSVGGTTVPSAVVTSSDIEYIHNDPVNALSVPGLSSTVTANWYIQSTDAVPSTIAPRPDSSILGKETYYVSLLQDHCESPKVPIVVTIKEAVINLSNKSLGFTPDGDAYNNEFVIDHIKNFPDSKLTILDKWGSAVFEKKNYNNEFDGKKDGKELPSGTYYFVLDLGNGSKQAGTLTILR